MELSASKDIEDERLKLQHDIQRIQDTLYEDSYSEYDSDSDSECLEIDLDRRNQTDDDGQTRSSIGESSTSHLGGTEVSDGTDFDQELFVGDAEATELPITTESSLALNRAYQEVIVDILHQIEESLEDNRQRQEDAERDLIGQREKNLTNAQYKVYYRQYCMPYIKDPNGGIPPPNEDVLLKKMLKEHKQDIMPERDWLVRDRKKMYDAIAEDSLQQLLQPLMIRLELEQEKLEKCEKTEEAAIVARIAVLEDDIANKRMTSRAELLKSVDVQKTDWLKISNIAYDGRKSWQECQMMWMNVLNPSVNRGKWDFKEDNHLMSLVKKFNGKNWVNIARLMNTGRTAFQCLQRYQVYLNPENLNRPWTAREDEKLLQIVRNIRNTGHRLVWGKVSSYMESRSANMCFSRYHQIDPDMKRGQWDKDEDMNLYTAVNMVGTKSWTKVAEFVPGRNSLQCRDRWSNSLDPTIRMGNWTYEEDKLMLLAAQELGTKSWTRLASRLPGRTDNQVLQRYKRLQNWERKMQWFEELPEATRRALLGGHLTTEELKAREHLTWQNFKKELCIDREDYEKQEQDRANGDIVVPRPPPLMGYTTLVPKRTIESRIQLQNIILKHVRSIKGHSDRPVPDPDGSEAHRELAVKVQFADANSVSVKKLLELSRHMKKRLSEPERQQTQKIRISPPKRKYNFNAVRKHRRLEEMLRESVQSLFKTKRKMKKGRPRKFFNRMLIGNYSEEEMHNINVKSLNLIMKALNVDARKMLQSATKVKEKKSTCSQSASSSTFVSKPDAVPCSTKSKQATKGKKKATREELADSEPEDEKVGDVDMLKSVSQREAESSEAGQEDQEEIEGIVMGVDKTTHGGETVQERGGIKTGKPTASITVKESSEVGHSETSLTKKTPLGTPQKKTVTFVVNECNTNKTEKTSNAKQGTRVAVKSFVRQTASQSGTSSISALASTSPVTRPTSALTSTVIRPTLTSTPKVTMPTSVTTPIVKTSATASTSKSVSTCTVSTQIVSFTDSDSSDELDYVNEKPLPLLPPNVTSLKAFKSLLLNRKKNISNAGSLYDPQFYNLLPSKYQSKPAQVAMDASAVNRKRGREAGETDAQPAKKVAMATNETEEKTMSLSREQLRKIHRTDEYQLLKARFQSIFVWPALMSTIHPPFDRKDFCEKANFITAGEEEVAHVQRSKTKGYPLDRSHRFYQKQVQPRAKKKSVRRKKCESSSTAEPTNNDDRTGTDDSTCPVIDLTAGDDTEANTQTEPPVKRRGRPKGKTRPYVVEKSARSMRERREKIVPEKAPPREPRGLRVRKKRTVLNPDLRRSMLASVAAMKEGLRPDPAKNIHPQPSEVILQTDPLQHNLICETPNSSGSDVSKKYTIILPTQLKPLKIKTSSSSESVEKHAVQNPQIDSTGNSQSTSAVPTPAAPAASTSTVVTVATTLDSATIADTVSVPMTNCSGGIPMMLSYVAGADGSVVPVLNPLPVKLLQNICSSTISMPQVKVEGSEAINVPTSSEYVSVPMSQSVEPVSVPTSESASVPTISESKPPLSVPSTSESKESSSEATTSESKTPVSVPTTSETGTSVSKSVSES